MKTAIQIVQEFARRQGLPVPQVLQANSDAQVVQVIGLLNEELDDLVGRYMWPQLQVEATFASTGVENQGDIDTIAPGYKSMIKDTLWSLSRRLRGEGSISPQATQAIKALGNPSAATIYRIVGGQLHFIPGTNIAAGDQYRFEYNSKLAVVAGDGSRKQYFELDSDKPVFPDSLILLGLRWRWRSAKGLNYAELFRLYEERVKQEFINARDAQTLSMTPSQGAKPGIVIPQGNWPT